MSLTGKRWQYGHLPRYVSCFLLLRPAFDAPYGADGTLCRESSESVSHSWGATDLVGSIRSHRGGENNGAFYVLLDEGSGSISGAVE